jgi:hypothetical protein
MAVTAKGRGEIGAEPVTASIALRIDALHGKAGHVLHLFSLSGRKAQIDSIPTARRRNRANFRAPLVGQKQLRKNAPGNFQENFANPFAKELRVNKCDGRDCGASGLWCQEKRLQDIVVRLHAGKKSRNLGSGEEVRRFSLTIRNSSY